MAASITDTSPATGPQSDQTAPHASATRFIRGVALATALPWLVALVSYLTGQTVLPLALAFLFLGTPHVLATFGLYLQPGLRPHIRQRAGWFLGLPLAAIVCSMAAFQFAGVKATVLLLTAFLIWQTQHFTKQNLGVFSFWCRAHRLSSPTSLERSLVRATMGIGILGILRAVDLAPALDGLLRVLGLGAIVVATALVLAVHVRGEWARTTGLLAAIAFYAPLHIFDVGLLAAAVTYQMAHGAQYYFMIGQVVRPTRTIRWATIVIVLAGGLVLVLAARVSPHGAAAWLFGLAKGVVAAHFIADAGLWKLRDPEIRAFMQDRFRFLAQ